MTGNSTQTQSGISWGEILGAAAQVGGAALGVPGIGGGKNRGTGNTAGLPVASTPWSSIPGSGMG